MPSNSGGDNDEEEEEEEEMVRYSLYPEEGRPLTRQILSRKEVADRLGWSPAWAQERSSSSSSSSSSLVFDAEYADSHHIGALVAMCLCPTLLNKATAATSSSSGGSSGTGFSCSGRTN